jgi:Domain of unknown function (DUF6538)
MALAMMRPTKHPRSGTYRLRLAIPRHLRDSTQRLYGCRAELIENLHTEDPREAKRRAPEADARLHARLAAVEAALRGEKAFLTDRQVAALAGIWYRRALAEHADNPGSDPGCTMDALLAGWAADQWLPAGRQARATPAL